MCVLRICLYHEIQLCLVRMFPLGKITITVGIYLITITVNNLLLSVKLHNNINWGEKPF